jgi:2-methylcitrate dehydratase PrpD
MMHAVDLDDYHNTKTHPGAAVIPAALAVAEARGCDGRRTLEAIVAGYEVMTRASLAAGPSAVRMRGWHLTGVFGPLGAAAAAAHLLGLDAQGTASALGLAGTQASGLWAFIADGSQSKRFHPGRAAQSGVLAAELAELGFAGPSKILEAEDGGLLEALSPESDPDRATADLGMVFHAGDTAIKPYAACAALHSAIDGLFTLQRRSGFKPEDVRTISVRAASVVVRQCGFRFEPLSALQAQMSAQYVLAVSLLDGACQLEQFAADRLHDPAVLELASRVEMKSDTEIERVYPEHFACFVDVVLQDGRRLTERVDDPKGSAARSMSEAEILEKFRSLARSVYGERTERILRQALHLHELERTTELTGLLAVPV